MKTNESRVFQHGDVVLTMSSIPRDVEDCTKEGIHSRGVIQEGEHTGHAHRLHGEGYAFFTHKKTNERYLKIVKPTPLRHEEHKEIMLPPGEYKIGIVREYDHFDEEARAVLD